MKYLNLLLCILALNFYPAQSMDLSVSQKTRSFIDTVIQRIGALKKISGTGLIHYDGQTFKTEPYMYQYTPEKTFSCCWIFPASRTIIPHICSKKLFFRYYLQPKEHISKEPETLNAQDYDGAQSSVDEKTEFTPLAKACGLGLLGLAGFAAYKYLST